MGHFSLLSGGISGSLSLDAGTETIAFIRARGGGPVATSAVPFAYYILAQLRTPRFPVRSERSPFRQHADPGSTALGSQLEYRCGI
jgi:hypothetical protein